MTTAPRLYARNLEPHKTFRQLSSENFVIALLDVSIDDTRLRQELCRLPNCHYFRASTIDECFDLITQDDAENALLILIISNRFLDSIRDNLLKFLPQLSLIYLFDGVLCNQQFSSDRRFRGTFDDADLLLTKIAHDIEEVRHPRRVDNGVQLISEDSAQFFGIDSFSMFSIVYNIRTSRNVKYYLDFVVTIKRIESNRIESINLNVNTDLKMLSGGILVQVSSMNY